MITKNTKKKILKTVRECKDSTDEDIVRISKACDRIAITDFEANKRIVKTADVADMLGMSTASVRSLVNTGKLQCYRKPGNKGWSGIIRSSVDEYIERVSRKDSRK